MSLSLFLNQHIFIKEGARLMLEVKTITHFHMNIILLYRVERWLFEQHIPTQFSPISVPGIRTVLIPLHTQYVPFPIFESAVIFELKMRKINSCTILGKTGICCSNSQRSTL